jgi:hypothetical protein
LNLSRLFRAFLVACYGMMFQGRLSGLIFVAKRS